MNANILTILIAILGSSGLTALINKWRFRAEHLKMKAETESIVQVTYDRLLASLHIELKRLTDEVQRLHERETHYILSNNSLISDKADLLSRVQRMEKQLEEYKLENNDLKEQIGKLTEQLNAA